jgi:uncharacterized protein YndB with AHSA1/START domain
MTAAAEPEVPTDSTLGAPVIEVSRVVPHSIDKVWQVLTTRAGAEALLGSGAQIGTKGQPWHSADGSHGVVRSYHPMQQVRLSWHADDQAPATTVDLQLTSEGEGTRLDLRHEHVPDVALSQSLQQRWEDALGQIGGATT